MVKVGDKVKILVRAGEGLSNVGVVKSRKNNSYVIELEDGTKVAGFYNPTSLKVL